MKKKLELVKIYRDYLVSDFSGDSAEYAIREDAPIEAHIAFEESLKIPSEDLIIVR